MKELHTDDLSMNSGKLFREQMIENFEVIEKAINDNKKDIDKMKKQQDTNVNSSIYDSFGK